MPPLQDSLLRAKTFSLPGCAYATPGDFPLSLAVAAFAAFAGARARTTERRPLGCHRDDGAARSETNDQYWHLGDGGILENTGVETIEELVIRQASGPNPFKRVLILSFDAGLWEFPQEFAAAKNLRLWTTDPGRVVSIADLRADAKSSQIWTQTKAKLGIPIMILTLNYANAKFPPATIGPRLVPPELRRASSLIEHIRRIPTSLKITACDADLMELAAKTLVDEAVREHGDELRSWGLLNQSQFAARTGAQGRGH